MKYHSLKMEEVNDTMRHLWNKTYQGTGRYFGWPPSALFQSFITDIDGIKIRSDVEGGASKRSYNYRVSQSDVRFNTTQFVHLGRHDERSGRNGYARSVLGWTENASLHYHTPGVVGLFRSKLWYPCPWWADQRAGCWKHWCSGCQPCRVCIRIIPMLLRLIHFSSIINERKNHSNFQLIIITHDENFLRKLGQADVMEYYWWVKNDFSKIWCKQSKYRRVSRDSRQKSVIERQRVG